MKKKILIFLLLLTIVSFGMAQQNSPYARRIYPVFADPPTPCSENAVVYQMITHQFLICKNTGWEEVGSGAGGGVIPDADTDTTGLLTFTDWNTFNNKQNFLGFTPENSANKGATNGYAELVSGKIPLARLQEVLASTDLSDFSTTSGSGTTMIKSTISAAASNDVLTWSGTNWINQAPLMTSVFGRTGVVTAQTGDYNASQVTNAFNTVTANNLTTVSAPSSPTIGLISVWADGTDKILKTKDNLGNVSITILPNTCTGTDKVSGISSAGIVTCTPDQTGGGSGLLTINGLTATDQNLTDVDDTNVTLTINSAVATHTFTIGWTGTLAKARQNPTTVYTDQANTFGNFVQTLQAGSNFKLVDPSVTTKGATFDLSNITAASTRIVNIPDANSTTVQSSTSGANQFATGISAQGVVSYTQPTFSNLSGSATDAQVPDSLSLTAIPNLTTNGFIKTSGGNGTLTIDTSTYLTGNQTITLSGDISGSGATSISTTIANNSVTGAKIAMGSDATGDIIYYNGTDYVRLAAGANNTVLTITGGIPSWVVGGGAAPVDATYITQTANGTLTNEQALGSLSTGILKNTTTTGVLSIAVSGTDYELPLTFSAPLSRATNTISCSTCALTTGNLSQFANTTSAQLAGIITNETGTGVLVFGTAPTFTTSISTPAISNLTTNGFVKTSGSVGTLSIDTNTYLTGNQTITLSGDVSGSGATSISTTIGNNTITGAKIALGSDATGDIMYYNGTDYVRLGIGSSGNVLTVTGGVPVWGSAGAGDMILASVQTVTGAKTFNPGKLIIGTDPGPIAVTINSFYVDTDDNKLYFGVDAPVDFWGEVFIAGQSLVNLSTNVTDILGVVNGGTSFSSYTKGDIIAASASTTLNKLGVGTNGNCLKADSTQTTGLIWGTCGSGTGDVVGPGSSTDNTIPRFDLTTGKLLQTSAVTIDDSNNISTAGNVSVGVGGSNAGYLELTQGTAPSNGTTSVILAAPTSVTSYRIMYPSAAATGIPHFSNSSNVITMSISAIDLASADVTGILPTNKVVTGTITNSRCLHVDGSGNITVTGSDCGAGGGGTPAGIDTNVQYNDGGAFGGMSNVLYNDSTGLTTFNQVANGNGIIKSIRFTDSSPTGNFLDFQNAAASTIYSVSVLGNVSTAGNVSVGVGGSAAGFLELTQGTAPSLGTTSVILSAPTSVTSYAIVYPTAAATGIPHFQNSSNVITMSISAIDLASADVTGTLTVNKGGTGVATITGILKGNGTSAFSAATAGTDYSSPSSTDTLTNKTLDVENTGNLFTSPKRLWFDAAACNGTTAAANFDLPTSSAPTASCTGTTTTVGAMDFIDGSTTGATRNFKLPSTFTGNVDINLIWFANSASSNAVRWSVSTGCVADTEATNTGPSYNTASATNSTYTGTANQRDSTSFTNVSKTNCAADETMWVRVERIGGDGGDTLAATAELLGMEVIIRTAE